jgi:hypothetical protein
MTNFTPGIDKLLVDLVDDGHGYGVGIGISWVVRGPLGIAHHAELPGFCGCRCGSYEQCEYQRHCQHCFAMK